MYIEIASAHGYTRDYFAVLVRLSYFAPDITAAIFDGHQPVQLTRQRLARAANLPLDWANQRAILGFIPPLHRICIRCASHPPTAKSAIRDNRVILGIRAARQASPCTGSDALDRAEAQNCARFYAAGLLAFYRSAMSENSGARRSLV